jgi:hypothetical protein
MQSKLFCSSIVVSKNAIPDICDFTAESITVLWLSSTVTFQFTVTALNTPVANLLSVNVNSNKNKIFGRAQEIINNRINR